MIKNKIWNEEKEKELHEKIKNEVEYAVEKFEQMTPLDPERMFLHTYANLPWFLKEERDYLKKYKKINYYKEI